MEIIGKFIIDVSDRDLLRPDFTWSIFSWPRVEHFPKTQFFFWVNHEKTDFGEQKKNQTPLHTRSNLKMLGSSCQKSKKKKKKLFLVKRDLFSSGKGDVQLQTDT